MGSNPTTSTITYAELAQLEELLVYTEEVGSSSLSFRTSSPSLRLKTKLPDLPREQGEVLVALVGVNSEGYLFHHMNGGLVASF